MRQYSRFQLNRGSLNKGSGCRQRDFDIERLHVKICLLIIERQMHAPGLQSLLGLLERRERLVIVPVV